MVANAGKNLNAPVKTREPKALTQALDTLSGRVRDLAERSVEGEKARGTITRPAASLPHAALH